MFLWIPVTPVITADGCDDGSDENDGAIKKDYVHNIRRKVDKLKIAGINLKH